MNLPETLGDSVISESSFFTRKSRELNFLDGPPADESFYFEQFFFLLAFFLKLTVFSVSLLFLSQLVILQVFESSYNLSLSLSNSLQKTPIPYERGLIVSRGGKIVAGNGPSFDL